MFRPEELLKATAGRLASSYKDTVIKGISIDSRSIKQQEAFIAIKGNNFDGHDFIPQAIKKGASCIIHSSLNTQYASNSTVFIKVKDTKVALGEISKLHREKFNIPIVAITGSNGKTTTKEMIAWILSKRYNVLKNEGTKNNQIGLPLTLLELEPSHDIVVLELGTNHPGEIEYLSKIAMPNIGVITNVGPAHLEGFGDLRGVFNEKRQLFRNLKKPYLAISNADDQLLRRDMLSKKSNAFILGFRLNKKSDFSASGIKIANGRTAFYLKRNRFTLKTLGAHNIYNALAAVAIARIFGMGYKEIISRLSIFNFPLSRLNLIEFNKIKFIDDTYNSNPLSLKQALDTLDNFSTKGRKIFVMGDMLELGKLSESFHRQMGKSIARICDAFIAVGRLSKFSAQTARTSGFDSDNIFVCEDTAEAKEVLFNKISPKGDDIILVKGSRLMRMEEVFNKAQSSKLKAQNSKLKTKN